MDDYGPVKVQSSEGPASDHSEVRMKRTKRLASGSPPVLSEPVREKIRQEKQYLRGTVVNIREGTVVVK